MTEKEGNPMKPRQCSLCNGKIKKGKTDFTVKANHHVISITNIPAYVCDSCGEAYFTPETSEFIDGLLERFSQNRMPLYPISAGEISYQEAVGIM